LRRIPPLSFIPPVPYPPLRGTFPPEQKAALIRGVTDLLANVLHKNPASTVVTIDEVPLENWGLGGDPILVAREKNQKK